MRASSNQPECEGPLYRKLTCQAESKRCHKGVGCAAFILVLLPPSVIADQVGDAACQVVFACPDLVVDGRTMQPAVEVRTFSETSCDVAEGMVQPGNRTLLRFAFTTPNVGPGDLVVGPPRARPDLFELSICHGHHHFREYADYRLWKPKAFSEWDTLRTLNPDEQPREILSENPKLLKGLIMGEKRGFCVIDVRMYNANALPAKYLNCDHAQGITAGWADEYGPNLPGQWVDITGLDGGTYVLETEVNAERFLTEVNYANNRAWTAVSISGAGGDV